MEQISTDVRFSIVPEAILDADISDRAVRIYGLLARYADSETGKCFPSRETLAKRARCHVRSVGRAIEELIAVGAIQRFQRRDGDGWKSNLYVVKRVVTGAPEGRAPTPEGRAQVPEGSDTGVPLTRTTELEPLNREPLNEKFAQFWSLYPRRVGKTAAKKAFDKAVDSVGLETVLDGVKRFASDPYLPETKFIPHPSTWLNEGRWDDDPYPVPTFDVKMTPARQTAMLMQGARARDEQDSIRKGIEQ